ncbi:hypothetical protein BGW38_000589 [Lunasporangiospora selenospora]|uniref:Protein kinase domain-containing protein n=1 Tax=Lunasporangiospora selenospora TaxID=979761 RepID=A0A9P6KEQ7_9FUNG|nr:hypothetical protein BGW38_000589 [Lunasporangiospora selenospora]
MDSKSSKPELVLEERIGGGTQAEVFLARYGLERVVAKKFKQPDDTISREMVIMRELHHSFIVQVFHIETDQNVLVMEYLKGGSLTDAIPTLNWNQKERIARQVSIALAYMHSKDIIHCDIKSSNILLTQFGDAKICDFGCARRTGEKDTGGTLPWMAPELIQDPPQYSQKSDVYALGTLMWEMTSGGKQPYEGYTWDGIRACIHSGRTEIIPKGTPKEFEVEIKRCWSYAAKDRPDAREVLDAVDVTQVPKTRAQAQEATATATEESFDEDECLRYLKRTIKQLDPKSCSQLGMLYYHGERVAQSYEEAVAWFQRGADLGDATSCSRLALMYLAGEGVPKDPRMSLEYLQKAAIQVEEDRKYHYFDLATGHLAGIGGSLDTKEAIKFFKKAADLGLTAAECYLLHIYHNGWGVPQDISEAMRLLHILAEKGVPIAQCRLGNAYFSGRSVEKDVNKAVYWWQRAIDANKASDAT